MMLTVALCALVAWAGATDAVYSHRWYCTQRGVAGDVEIFQYTCGQAAPAEVDAICCRCNKDKCDDVNHPCKPSIHKVDPAMCRNIAKSTGSQPAVSSPAVSEPAKAHVEYMKRHINKPPRHRHLNRRKYYSPVLNRHQELKRRRLQITQAPMNSQNSWHRQGIPQWQAPQRKINNGTPPPRRHNANWTPPNLNRRQRPRQASPNASPPRSWGSSGGRLIGTVPMSQQRSIPQQPSTTPPPDSVFLPPDPIFGPPTYCCGARVNGRCPQARQPNRLYCCPNIRAGSDHTNGDGQSGACPSTCGEKIITRTKAPDRHRWCVCNVCSSSPSWTNSPGPVQSLTPNRQGWCLIRRPAGPTGRPYQWQGCKTSSTGRCRRGSAAITCHMCHRDGTHCWNQVQADIRFGAQPHIGAGMTVKKGSSGGMGGGTIFVIILMVMIAIGGIWYFINEQQKGGGLTSQLSTNVMSGNDNEDRFFQL